MEEVNGKEYCAGILEKLLNCPDNTIIAGQVQKQFRDFYTLRDRVIDYGITKEEFYDKVTLDLSRMIASKSSVEIYEQLVDELVAEIETGKVKSQIEDRMRTYQHDILNLNTHPRLIKRAATIFKKEGRRVSEKATNKQGGKIDIYGYATDTRPSVIGEIKVKLHADDLAGGAGQLLFYSEFDPTAELWLISPAETKPDNIKMEFLNRYNIKWRGINKSRFVY